MFCAVDLVLSWILYKSWLKNLFRLKIYLILKGGFVAQCLKVFSVPSCLPLEEHMTDCTYMCYIHKKLGKKNTNMIQSHVSSFIIFIISSLTKDNDCWWFTALQANIYLQVLHLSITMTEANKYKMLICVPWIC